MLFLFTFTWKCWGIVVMIATDIWARHFYVWVKCVNSCNITSMDYSDGMPHENNKIWSHYSKCVCDKNNASFPVRGRISKLSVLLECWYVVLSVRNAPTQAAQNLSHLSASEITHTHCAFVCLPWVTAHQLPGSVDRYYTQIHRLHCRPAPCTSIIIMHSRNSNSSSSFWAEAHCTNFFPYYATERKPGTWKSILVISVADDDTWNASVNSEANLDIYLCFPCVVLFIFFSRIHTSPLVPQDLSGLPETM